MADTTRSSSGPTSRDRSTVRSDKQGSAVGERAIADARDMGTELIGAVRDNATNLFNDQRNRAADQIAAIGEALRRSAEAMDNESVGFVSRYADEAARQIDDFAHQLRSRSWQELAGGVEDFARRWPIAFMTASIATGFVAGRFLLSSPAVPERTGSRPEFTPRPIDEEQGSARHDYGRVSGEITGRGRAGYGAVTRETK